MPWGMLLNHRIHHPFFIFLFTIFLVFTNLSKSHTKSLQHQNNHSLIPYPTKFYFPFRYHNNHPQTCNKQIVLRQIFYCQFSKAPFSKTIPPIQHTDCCSFEFFKFFEIIWISAIIPTIFTFYKFQVTFWFSIWNTNRNTPN